MCTIHAPLKCPVRLIPQEILPRDLLLVIIVGFIIDNIEEAKLVNTLRGGHDTEPVAQLLLLEELLRTKHRIS